MIDMESKKRIMVIDDDLECRKDNYQNALGERYDVEYSEDADLIYDQIKKSKADLYIIDLNLDQFTDPETNRNMHVNDILRVIGKNKPIILLSDEYPELAKNGRLQSIIKGTAEKDYNVCSFLTWDEIKQIDYNETRIKEDQLHGYKDAMYSRIDFCINRDRTPKYSLGIVCALEEELEPFMQKVQPNSIKLIKVNGISYKEGVIRTKSGKEIYFISACSTKMGIADASILATHMSMHWGVKNLFMLGVCGGREGKVDIGDVIVPLESVAYQRGKMTKKGFSSDIEIAKHKELMELDVSSCQKILKRIYKEYLNSLIERDETIENLKQPIIHNDAMACADYVVDKKGFLDKISKIIGKRKLCAVDMESYAIFRVGDVLDFNTLVIKSVMDLSNNKSDKYKEYAAFIAANYLYQLLYREELIMD